MNVLHIIDNFGLGGCQSLLKAFFENQKENKAITLFSLRKVRQTIHIDHQNIIESKSSSKYSVFPVFQLFRIIKERDISVLHCHLFRSQVFGVIVKIFSKKEIKLVFHEHGQIFGSEHKIKIDDFLYIWVLKIFTFKVNRFIAVSNAAKNKLIARAKVKPAKIEVLYNFISQNFIQSNLIKNPGLYPNSFYVGFAGRLVERKGWKVFLEAAKILKDNSNIKFLVAGNGPDKKMLLETISTYELKDKVEYIGFVSDIITDFYSRIDCLVIPSEWEPMGLVELEAQALSVPVIGSNVEALNEILTNNVNGLLFKVNNANEISDKILMVYSNPALKNSLVAGGLENVRKYSIENYIFEIQKIYC